MVLNALAPEVDVLQKVTVRLLADSEVGQFNHYLETEHYLASSRYAGQALRYVAEVAGQWVALLTFSAPALQLKARERWIGWSPRQRARRLGLVVSNSRFLVLPERQRYPNLASRVLGLALRRLSADWQARWAHPVLVVESFVDESQYRGTCYRACGFEAVGATAGFGRSSRDFYEAHGQPKQLYLRELRPRARQQLRQARWPADLAAGETESTGPCPFRAPALESLLDRLGTLRDERRGHGLRHRQRFVLACAAVDGTIALRRLSSEQQQLKERLRLATKELFGEARSDATEVTAALKRSFRDEMAPLPRVTAYDLLDRISRKMPPAEEVAIDVQDLEIKSKKTSIKGTVDSAASLDDVVAKLKELDCFEEINKGPLTEVSGGAKQFSLTINSKCP